MNQFYHPARAAAFFQMLAERRDIPVFTVTNTAVHDLTTYDDADKKVKTLDGVRKFLESNGCGLLLFSVRAATTSCRSFGSNETARFRL